MNKSGYVYILSSHARVLYIGVTGNLKVRLFEHRTGVFEGFASDSRVNQLVYFEVFPDLPSAISREKQLKGWSRKKKIALIERENPSWEDLSPVVNAGQVLRLRLGLIQASAGIVRLAFAQDDRAFDSSFPDNALRASPQNFPRFLLAHSSRYA